MEGIQWWAREQAEHLGKGYAWNLICKYIWRFSSKAVAYRFGDHPGVAKISALGVCFGYLRRWEEAQLSWPLFTLWVARVGSPGPSSLQQRCVGSAPQQPCVTDGCVLLSLLSDEWFPKVLIVLHRILMCSCLWTERCSLWSKTPSHFISNPCARPSSFSVMFSCWIHVWEREPENHILAAVLIHNLISVCCSIARLLGRRVSECAGIISPPWLNFTGHQITLSAESPEQAGLAVMVRGAPRSSRREPGRGSLLWRCP